MFEIYFSDLTPEAQERFLASCGLSSAAEGNYDVFPIQPSPLRKWTGRAQEQAKTGPVMRNLPKPQILWNGRNPGMNEVKHERFRRIVEKRMTGIIKDLKKLGNCAEPASYEYTEREAEQIIAELELQIFHLRERFAGRKRFSLRNEDNTANDTPDNAASFEVDCGVGVIVVDELLSGPHPGVRVFFKLPDCNRPEEN